MICPKCSNSLQVLILHGIEIDHCLSCKGVWLDRGELEKVIERSNWYDNQMRTSFNSQDYYNDHCHSKEHKAHIHNDYYHNNHDSNQHYHNRSPKEDHDHQHNSSYKRRSFLTDLFDF